MNDRPVLLGERVDAVGGNHAAGIGIVRPEADQPGIAHFGQRGIGAAEANGFGGTENIGRHRMILRRADRAEEGDNVGLSGELREGEHRARIGRLVVLGDEFNLFSQHAPRLIDAFERDFGAGQRVFAAVGGRAGDGQHHANLDRFVRSAGDAGKRRRRQTGGESQIHGPSCEPHRFLSPTLRFPIASRRSSPDGQRLGSKLAEFGRPCKPELFRRATLVIGIRFEERPLTCTAAQPVL